MSTTPTMRIETSQCELLRFDTMVPSYSLPGPALQLSSRGPLVRVRWHPLHNSASIAPFCICISSPAPLLQAFKPSPDVRVSVSRHRGVI